VTGRVPVVSTPLTKGLSTSARTNLGGRGGLEELSRVRRAQSVAGDIGLIGIDGLTGIPFRNYRICNIFWHGKSIIPAIYATLINYLVQECHWN
jgi:hypothetical protein